jgi:hypothetical protein
MAIAKSALGRLRQAVFHTAETAARATGIPVRSIRNYESGGGTAPRFKKERVDYANWLLDEAHRLKLPDIPTLADLVPDVYGQGQEEEKAPALTGANTRCPQEYESTWNRGIITHRDAVTSGIPITGTRGQYD